MSWQYTQPCNKHGLRWAASTDLQQISEIWQQTGTLNKAAAALRRLDAAGTHVNLYIENMQEKNTENGIYTRAHNNYAIRSAGVHQHITITTKIVPHRTQTHTPHKLGVAVLVQTCVHSITFELLKYGSVAVTTQITNRCNGILADS